MGIDISRCEFDSKSFDTFQRKLNENLDVLAEQLKQPGFGHAKPGSKHFGAELEMYIVNDQGRPLKLNEELRQIADDELLTLEINRYNLEYNLRPYGLNETPFIQTERDIVYQLDKLNKLASKYDGFVLPIGILPTLTKQDFGKEWMTDRVRYHVLVEQLKARRGRDFEIDINGMPPLKMAMSDVTLEGANTSFQVHYRITPERYAALFNAFQLVTPLVLSVSGNSPDLFGHQLWHETRIPLFKQSIDTRVKDRYSWHAPSRVCFGQGWVRQSALELFQETARIYPPLLPVCDEENPWDALAEGRVPQLAEMKLHQSSVWLWNRPVYDDADGGHFRIELRALPAGPSAIDMVANAAFYIGLAEYYASIIDSLLPALPFHLCEYNFYRAAQSGMNAKIVWPEHTHSGCQEVPIIDVLKHSVSKAEKGLQSIGIEQREIDRYLSVIEQRMSRRQTGAVWQSARMRHYINQGIETNEVSAISMLRDYRTFSLQNMPVSAWET